MYVFQFIFELEFCNLIYIELSNYFQWFNIINDKSNIHSFIDMALKLLYLKLHVFFVMIETRFMRFSRDFGNCNVWKSRHLNWSNVFSKFDFSFAQIQQSKEIYLIQFLKESKCSSRITKLKRINKIRPKIIQQVRLPS